MNDAIPSTPHRDQAFIDVHAELVKIARRELAKHRVGATLETRALVNEAYLKLFDRTRPEFANRAHLIASGAQAMRQIIIDYARSHLAQRRGGGCEKISFDDLQTGSLVVQDQAAELVCVHEAMSKLGEMDPRLEKVVELRFFAGLDVEEVAEVLGVSGPTIKRDTRAALAFLTAYAEAK